MNTKTLIFILFLVGISSQLCAQDRPPSDSALRLQTSPAPSPSAAPNKAARTQTHIDRDIRIGVDISTMVLGILTPKRMGLDLSAETQISQSIYAIAEGGYQSYEKSNTYLQYKAQGSYYRLGIDWNMRKPKTQNDEDILYLGARYAFSPFTQEIPTYIISDGDWGNSQGHIAAEQATAHWVEAIIGFKVEVLKNLFLGMGARFKVLLHSTAKDIAPVVYVPGYARNYNTLVFNFNYNIYYNIPWHYKKHKIAVYE